MQRTILAVEDPKENESLARIRRRLATVPAAIERADKIGAVSIRQGSELALDDEATHWRELSHGLSYALGQAADGLHALNLLLPPEGEFAMPVSAHFPVARATLEASALALWIVGPDDPRLRIDRHMRNAWREVSEEASFMSAITRDESIAGAFGFDPRDAANFRKSTARFRRKHVTQIRQVTKALRLDDPTAQRWTVGFAEIVRDATKLNDLPGEFGEMVWRNLSGLSHPSALHGSRHMRAEVIAKEANGTNHVRLTSNVSVVSYSIDAALLLFNEAVRVTGSRKVRAADPAAYRPVGDP